MNNFSPFSLSAAKLPYTRLCCGDSVSDNVCMKCIRGLHVRFICIRCAVWLSLFFFRLLHMLVVSHTFFPPTMSVRVCVFAAPAEIAVSLVLCANATPAFYFLASDNDLIEYAAYAAGTMRTNNHRSLCLIRLFSRVCGPLCCRHQPRLKVFVCVCVHFK